MPSDHALSPSELAARTPSTRDRAIDFLRVASLGVVMVGHTLMASVEPDGRVGNVLAALPAAQLLTWVFQVVPVFFLVGGYAHAAALRNDPPYARFLATRFGRLLPPAAVLVGGWLTVGLLLDATGHASGLPRSAARIAVQPLWFLGVYLGVTALAPSMLALHRRHGLRVVGVLAAVTAVLDLVRFSSSSSSSVPSVAYLSVATVWLAVHSLGFALHDGTLDRRGRTLALGGLGAAGALVVFGPYPTSMVGLPGAPVSNMSPPTLALLAHAFWLTGLVVVLRPALRRWLTAQRVWTAVVAANGVAMTAFLWHLTALFGVLALAPRPATGSREWWLTRPPVVAATVLGTIALVAVFRRCERPATLPPRSPSVAAAGAATSALGLLAISATGAIGIVSGRTSSLAGVPVMPSIAVLLLAAGCLLSGVPVRAERVGPDHVAERP